MRLIRNLFNAVSKEEQEGIFLDVRTPQWEVSRPESLPEFLQALNDLLPKDSILYLEGGDHPETLKVFLDNHSIAEVAHPAMGTIWPKPKTYHLPVTKENLFELAAIVTDLSWADVVCHLHVYQNDKILLQWYDSFCDEFYVSKEISEEKLVAFCQKLSLNFETWLADGDKL